MIFLLGVMSETIVPLCTALAAVIGAVSIGLDICQKIEQRQEKKKGA